MDFTENIEKSLKGLKLMLPKYRREVEVFDLYSDRLQNLRQEIRGAAYYSFSPKRFEQELKMTAEHLYIYLKNRVDSLRELYNEYTKLSSNPDIGNEQFDEIAALLLDVSALVSRGEGYLEILKRR